MACNTMQNLTYISTFFKFNTNVLGTKLFPKKKLTQQFCLISFDHPLLRDRGAGAVVGTGGGS